LALKGRGHGSCDFVLACKRADGAPISVPAQLCHDGSASTSALRTAFVVNGGSTFRVRLTQPWHCLGSHGGEHTAATGTSDSGTTSSTRAPVADFRMSVRSGPAPLTVTFTNKSSDANGDSFTSLWDFGDGSQSSAANPSHTYTTVGQFQVTLVVTDT